jgi:hypothetical protein
LAGEWQPCLYKISLKLFNINNCANRAFASRASAATDELLEVALEGFLLQMDFCKAELAGDDCPAAILMQFVDLTYRWIDGGILRAS